MSADEPHAGRFEGGEHRFAIRIYYEDTDAAGVVYHANYLRFMERARTDMLALCGADVGQALRDGVGGYVVAAAELRFISPARLGDALLVTSRIAEIGGASCAIQQRVSRDGQEVATGRVAVVFVAPGGRPRRQPASWIEALRAVQGG